jgi:gamma-glutamyltranspeptidase
MMEFTYKQKREWDSAAQRSVAMGVQGMVASSQPLATLTGYKILQKGGNAVDAAVGMVSTLNVVEPHSVGLGGDAFALIYLPKEKKLVGINASGRAQSIYLDRRQNVLLGASDRRKDGCALGY